MYLFVRMVSWMPWTSLILSCDASPILWLIWVVAYFFFLVTRWISFKTYIHTDIQDLARRIRLQRILEVEPFSSLLSRVSGARMLSSPCLAGYVMWLLDQLPVHSCLHQRMTLLLTVSAVRQNGPRNQLPADSPDSRSWSLRSGFKGHCGTAWSFYCCCLRSLLTGEWTTWASEFMNEATTHILFFFFLSLLNFGFCWKVKNTMFLFLFYLIPGIFYVYSVEAVENQESLF